MENNTSFGMNGSKTNYLENKGDGSYSKNIIILNCVLNAPLMLTTILGNSLVLATILRTPSLRSPSTVFLCSLAVSDLLVGLVVQPVYIVDKLKPGMPIMNAYFSLVLLLCGVSLGTMTALSVDRLLALQCHMRYPTLVTKKRAIYIIVKLWFGCLFLSCIHFAGQEFFIITVVVGTALCFLVSTFSYIRIYQLVRRHQLQIEAQQRQLAQNYNVEHKLNIVQAIKSALYTFIYYICLILCYSPVFISMLRFAITPESWTMAWNLADTVVFMNSSINPFLYCLCNGKLRAAVLKTLRTILFRQAGGN